MQQVILKSTNLFLNRLWLAGRNLFWFIIWLIAWGLIILYPLRWVSGDSFVIVRALSYFMPWLLVLLTPVMLLAWLTRRTWLAAILALPLLLISLTVVPLVVPLTFAAPPADDFSIKIMSHNVFGNQDAGAVAGIIRTERPDIVVLQEFNSVISATLIAELADVYPGDKLYVSVISSQAAVSRYPIVRTDAAWDKGRVQKMMIKTPFGPIALWNVHFYPPFMYPAEIHDQQTAAFVGDVAGMTDNPLIVVGDFNVTDQSEAYRTINRYLKNARWKIGWGFGFTFPARPHAKGLPVATGPLYRLDHIFYSDHFIVRRAETLLTAGGSDHLPILAQLSLDRAYRQ